jgi:hypothetical protein
VATTIDLTGQQFGRLTVLSDAGRAKSRGVIWNCLCTCGAHVTVTSRELLQGDTRSCGCFRAERTAERFTVHGHAANGERSPTYRSWRMMLARCTNLNAKDYPRYGGANPPVRICSEWLTFAGFLADMGERPAGTSLGRILDIKNYKKSNVFWMTDAEQKLAARNKRALLKWVARAA